MLNCAQINKYFKNKPPMLSASIRVTKACNLKCMHCYANAGKQLEKELSFNEIKDILNQFNHLGSTSIFFTGGEPFLRKDMPDLINYASSLGMSVYLSTNGTLLNKEILQKIKNSRLALFQISMDGSNSKLHDGIRGIPGVFKKAKSALALSSKILKENVGVGTVLMKDNHEDLSNIIKTASTFGADTFALIILLDMGRAEKIKKIDAIETFNAIQKMFKVYKKNGKNIKFALNTTLPPPLIPKELRKELWNKFCFCSFPYTLGIEANGDVAPCDGFFSFKETILGNIHKKKLKDIWYNSKLIKKLKSIKPSDLKGVCNKCKYVEYCNGGCRAAAYQKYKDFLMPDPLCQSIYEAGLFPKECLKNEK